jgi:hypothetical protein
MTIQQTAESILKNAYEVANGVNLYGYTPKDFNTHSYKKAKNRALKYTKINNMIEINTYIKNNL